MCQGSVEIVLAHSRFFSLYLCETAWNVQRKVSSPDTATENQIDIVPSSLGSAGYRNATVLYVSGCEGISLLSALWATKRATKATGGLGR